MKFLHLISISLLMLFNTFGAFQDLPLGHYQFYVGMSYSEAELLMQYNNNIFSNIQYQSYPDMSFSSYFIGTFEASPQCDVIEKIDDRIPELDTYVDITGSKKRIRFDCSNEHIELFFFRDFLITAKRHFKNIMDPKENVIDKFSKKYDKYNKVVECALGHSYHWVEDDIVIQIHIESTYDNKRVSDVLISYFDKKRWKMYFKEFNEKKDDIINSKQEIEIDF